MMTSQLRNKKISQYKQKNRGMAKKKCGHVFGVLGIKHGEMRIKMYKTIAVLVCFMITRRVLAKRQESHILHFCIQKSSRDEIT